MSQLPLTQHAKERRRQRGITEHQIEAALTEPDSTYPSRGGIVYRRGEVLVVVNDEGTILTVSDRRTGLE